MATVDVTYPVQLGFLPLSQAIPDPDHPGLLRAGPRASGPYGDDRVEMHVCPATDWAQDDTVQPTLFDHGFDAVDLSELETLQRTLTTVRDAGRISDADAETIRAELAGTTLRLGSGATLEVLQLAGEGLIMRSSGPNRLSVTGPRTNGMNDHGSATSIHADQDVYGTPLTQIMDGRAPSLFRHDSPDGQNRDARLMLVNLWIPLRQVVQPLLLADGRSIDRRRHQLRYGLATESFLDREDDLAINDIWAFLHDADQRWYFRSDMDQRSAYVFDTLSTPHGAGVLPGEDVAEQLYLRLESAEAAAGERDVVALTDVVVEDLPAWPAEAITPALQAAIAAMAALLDEARADPAEVCGSRAAEWQAASQAARRRVVRMSLEMRMVVSVQA